MRSWRAMNANRLCTRRRKSRSVPLLSSSAREMVNGTDCFERADLSGSPCLAAMARSALPLSRDTNRLPYSGCGAAQENFQHDDVSSGGVCEPLVGGGGEVLHHVRTRDPRM